MKKKILLVDDVKEFRTLVKIILSGNYDVVTAADGQDALNKIHKGLTPDVIVTDLMMPNVNGFQLINKIKSGEGHKKTPIIVLSNIDGAEEKERLKKQGIAEYIIKPFKTTELIEGLGKSLNSLLINRN